MAEETDGIEEAFEGQLRLLVTAAAQVGERLAREREQSLRRAEARSEQEARELQSRLAAEQRTARGEMGNVHRSQWWDQASAEQIGHAYQVARAWGNEDPEAVRAEQRMRDELRGRYGIDVDNTQANPAAVRAAVERAQREWEQGEAERNQGAEENAEAQRLMTQADHEERRAAEARAAAEHEPDAEERVRAAAEAERREATADHAHADGRNMYDSAQRRDGTARELEAKGIHPETVATRMRADVSQGKPATEAVKGTGRNAPKARARRRRGAQLEVQRTGPSR